MKQRILPVFVLAFLLLVPGICLAQVTASDYDRATKLRDRFQGLAVNIAEPANAIEKTSRFWYRKSVKGGNEFVMVDAESLASRAAFDHERLAASLSAAAGQKYTAQTSPFNTFRFVENETAKRFDFLTVPGGNHGAGGAYYQRLLQDFFVHHLQGTEPPDWNSLPATR